MWQIILQYWHAYDFKKNIFCLKNKEHNINLNQKKSHIFEKKKSLAWKVKKIKLNF